MVIKKATIKATLTSIGILLLSIFAFMLDAQAAPINVKFRVFDENGVELTYKQINSRMTNGRPSIISSGTFELSTLKALTLGEHYNSGGKWTMPFTDIGQGMVIHWNTNNTGYSSFLLDNGGQGFQKSETVIFNQRLAEDAKRQFDNAVTKRGDYARPSQFLALQGEIEGCFVNLRKAGITASEQGRIGQQCLDLVAQAMTMLLREYGTQRAAALGNTARWGVTIIPQPTAALATEYKKIDDLVTLFAPQHRWARIAMNGDGTDNLQRIYDIAAYAKTKGVKTMGQLFDSTNQANVPLATFKTRVDQALAFRPNSNTLTLGEIMAAWEVGNEANGLWLGTDVPAKINYAASKVKGIPGQTKKDVVLTFYWYSIQDELVDSLFNWIDQNKPFNNVDQIALSIYVDEQPLNFAWDLIMTKLSEIFPGKPIMSGELDYDVAGYYLEGPKSSTGEQRAQAYIKNRYPSSFATPNSIGGGFWWYYDDDMVGKKPRWVALRETYCAAYPLFCQ